MPAHNEIDTRMKENYENPYRIKLTKRIPVIVRIDGKAFHTFTRGFNKPFDSLLVSAMQYTMKFLCENIMGCKIGYTQSDEISLLLTDYDTFSTQPYFDYNIQKIASICASMATLEFNRAFNNLYNEYIQKENKDSFLCASYGIAKSRGAMFDARCFNVPREEVTNYFYSRQLDASRNSVEMLGRSKFSDKELHGKNTSNIQDMLHDKYNINWSDLPTELKRGSCCIKVKGTITIKDKEDIESEQITINEWKIDHNIPVFKGEDRGYIDQFINIDQKQD